MISDSLFALSIAFIQILDYWRFLFYTNPEQLYYLEQFGTYHYLASILFLASISLIVFLGCFIFRKTKKEWVKYLLFIGLLFLLLNPSNYFRSVFGISMREILSGFLDLKAIFQIILFLLVISFIPFVIKFRAFFLRRTTNLIYITCLLFAPFAILNLFNLTYQSFNEFTEADAILHSNEINEKNKSKQRVVWIIFDEMGYRPSFSNRPENIKLPNLDYLVNQSFIASNAIKPGPDTLEAIPSLLIGKHVKKAFTNGSSDLLLEFSKDNKPILKRDDNPIKNESVKYNLFSDQDHIFKQTNESGYNLAILGLGHPYCRLFDGLYEYCYNQFIPRQTIYDPDSLYNVFSSLVVKLWPFVQDRRLEHTYAIKNSIELGLKFVSDPDLDLIFLHYHFPHSPYFYNPSSDEVSVTDFFLDYFDNLILVDKTLGRFIEGLKETNLWDSTSILISSDHGWRKENWTNDWKTESGNEDHRVPFILRIPNENLGMDQEVPIDTIYSRIIVDDLLLGKIRTHEDIIERLVFLDYSSEYFQHLKEDFK